MGYEFVNSNWWATLLRINKVLTLLLSLAIIVYLVINAKELATMVYACQNCVDSVAGGCYGK